ncbi:MAG TPA: AmmeMemoRadiSam system protein B [Nitrososphaerales archaeon]|nr:AmmeMemoRadiSam system protein B [Nitrososphaerales archaeon]
MTVRRAAVAGSFYPSCEADLRAAIEGSYLHRLGPGKLPSLGIAEEGLKACVCPHAGYAYSGPVAAHSYLDVAQLRSPELVVIVGPNHYGLGSGVATYGEGEWETPLGKVKVDADASKRIVELTGFVDVDPEAHRREHSIEVQLPFLQYLYGESFSFLPISLAFQEKAVARDLGKGLAELLKEAAEVDASAVLIASSDLTHYEPASQAKEKDTMLLKHVQSLDVDAFYTALERRNITACGYGAIATAMEACKLLGYEKGRVNAYATSGDVTGENDAVVGYPSVSFLEG